MSTVLLIIDVQRALVDYLPPERRAEFLGTLGGVIERARSGGTAVVYVRHDGGPDDLSAGTPEWEIADEIAPRAGEPIVEKHFRNAFRETNLSDVLSALDADHLVAGGMQTDYCVDATIREAEQRGYRVTLIEDGSATYAAGGLTEQQIRDHVHRIARGSVAEIVPAAELFVLATEPLEVR